MIKKIHVHLNVNVTKKFDVDIPQDSDYIQLVRAMVANDPVCRHLNIKNVIYDIDTEVPISVEYFVKVEKLTPYRVNKTMMERLNKLSLFLEQDKPLQAFEKLVGIKNRKSLANQHVKLIDDVGSNMTVDELLEKIKV